MLLSLPAAAQTVVRETTVPVQPTTVQTTTVQPTEVAGTVTEYTPDAVIVRTQEATAPVRYSFTKTTEYVDESGRAVAREIVRTGVPVTVRYIREGDHMIVNRVIVHQAVEAVPAVPAAPEAVTIQKSTTTTTTTEEGHKKHHDHDKDKDKDNN